MSILQMRSLVCKGSRLEHKKDIVIDLIVLVLYKHLLKYIGEVV